MSEKQADRPRRKFLLSAIILGLAGSLGLYHGTNLFRRRTYGQTIQMITRDGNVVEVDARHIESKEFASSPLSDEELGQFKRTDARHRSHVKQDDND